MSVDRKNLSETAEKEVQDTSCRGVWGCPPALKVPQDWGIEGVDCNYFSSPKQINEQSVGIQLWH